MPAAAIMVAAAPVEVLEVASVGVAAASAPPAADVVVVGAADEEVVLKSPLVESRVPQFAF